MLRMKPIGVKMKKNYHKLHNGITQDNRTAIIECPFCKRQIHVYIWSLAGSGKKCICGAKIGRYYAMKGE